MRFRITDESGQVLAEHLPEECRRCVQDSKPGIHVVTCSFDDTSRRQGRLRGTHGEVYACSDDETFLKSKRMFKQASEALLILVGTLKEMRSKLELSARKDAT